MKNLKEILLQEINANSENEHIMQLKMEYGLAVLKNEGIKLILLSSLYLILGMEGIFIFCAAVLIPLRLFSGGLHMKTNVGCFLFSFIFFLLAIVVLPKLLLSKNVYRWLLIISGFVVCLLPPVAVSSKPIVSRKKSIRCKMRAILYCIILVATLFLIEGFSRLYFCGVWTLSLQALQLAFAYYFNRKEGVEYEGSSFIS